MSQKEDFELALQDLADLDGVLRSKEKELQKREGKIGLFEQELKHKLQEANRNLSASMQLIEDKE